MNATVLVAGGADPGCSKTWPRLAAPGSTPPAAARAAVRAVCVVFFSGIALLELAVRLPFVRTVRRRAARAAWLHRWCRVACRVLGLRLTTTGSIPRSGLLVSNHLSYLDIVALSALRPCVFVAKRDVRAWPLFGWLARAAGTIFVTRECRCSAKEAVAQIGQALASNLLVVLFPEGTSSDGATVLPFKSSLLQTAVSSRAPVVAAGIDYHLLHGSVGDEICYWRDMTLLPHLCNLLGKPRIDATVRFSSAQPRGTDRKALARELRAEVAGLRL